MSVSSCLSFELVRFLVEGSFLLGGEGCGGQEGSWVKGLGGVLASPYIYFFTQHPFLSMFSCLLLYLIFSVLGYGVLYSPDNIFSVFCWDWGRAVGISGAGYFLKRLLNNLPYFSCLSPPYPTSDVCGTANCWVFWGFYSLNCVCSWLSPLFAKDLIF